MFGQILAFLGSLADTDLLAPSALVLILFALCLPGGWGVQRNN